ncbi:MAG: linear amide C-N hydrolase [Ignavibacteria bacterium]|nr:linear amide C-N hydrolase [Ignavibacteria bacterium]
MDKRRFTALGLLIASVIALGISCCKNKSLSTDDESLGSLSRDTLKTLQSLEKVNDYPLFVMTYYGDYGFRRLLKTDRSRNPVRGEARSPVEAPSWQCTCFAGFGDGSAPVFGRNFDWRHRACLLLLTDPPDGYASVSMVDIYYCGYGSNPDLASLESRMDLLRAPFLPFDGMNEKGVAIGIMAVPYVELPYDPGKRTLNDLAVIRLVLDYAESTEHAVSLIRNYNIRMDEVPLHYFIADRSGKSAVLEFVSSEMKVLYNNLPYQVSTNFILSNYAPHLTGRCWRYDLVSDVLQNSGGSISMSGARDLLRNVSQGNTMWSAVYNLKSGDVQIVPGRRFASVYSTKLTPSN